MVGYAVDKVSAEVLGPFVLESVIGSGGMGVVWRAWHRAQGVPVAIKVIEHRLAREERYRAAFRHEVRAVASLEHPGIVGVYDYGEVPMGHGALPEGSPYLVMEYVEHGSLDQLQERMSWPLVRHVALGVLDALSHAHARGIVHRDMKPGNVLLARAADGVLGIKLTDFGVAHALGAEGDQDVIHASAGTLAYMPWEQSQGLWRDFGPWTDLYAVGCMVWELVSGRAPYEGGNAMALILQHYQAPVPRLAARFEVPEALEGWLRRLLQKAPEGRYMSAADAAWALRQLAGEGSQEQARFSSVWPTLRNVRSASHTPTLLWGEAAARQLAEEVDWGRATTLALEGAQAAQPGELMASLAWRDREVEQGPLSPPGERPPWEAQWRRAGAAGQHKPLTGAGLGLYGLRELPLVGRQQEREAIWQALGEVSRGGQPRCVVVRGPSGVGKSRLVEWMAVRAQELGQATWMRASYGPLGGPAEGMGRMISNHVQGTGMERAGPLALLGSWLVVPLVIIATGLPWALGLVAMLAALLIPCWFGVGRIRPALRLLREGEQAVALRSEGFSPLTLGSAGEFMTLGGRYRSIPALFEEGSRAQRARMLYLEGEGDPMSWSQLQQVMGWE